MELAKVLLQRYPSVRGYIKGSIYQILPELDIRKRPAGMNSIVWNIWHMARTEDVGINRLVTDGQQVFDQSDWMQKLNIDFRHFGTGMSKEEVDSLSENINLEALKNYHDAVEEQTRKVFAQLSTIDLEDEPNEYHIYNVLINEGVLHPNALWVEKVYRNKSRAWFLTHLGLTHNFEHLGQILTIRKLLGYKGNR